MNTKILLSISLWVLSNTLSAAALSTTITNPTPANLDYFGYAIAAVGSDRVLVGAYGDDTGAANAGAAYLFTAGGSLITTFTNPSPTGSELFGYAVTALNDGHVLIGCPNDRMGFDSVGAVYLFRTNGILLTALTNPIPHAGESFGYAIAALGNDRVLIGAPGSDIGATTAGAAYLFSTNGTLLSTFTNPAPAVSDPFGYAVAAVGTDHVLVSAMYDDTGATDAGAVYLFRTNGTLVATINNPTPAEEDYFGAALAAVGGDRFLIGAPNDNTGAADAGVAYLFSTNGNLLLTLTNPAPADGEMFAMSVAAVGSYQLLVGNPADESGAGRVGSACLFSITGALLMSYTNPTPAHGDFFGYAVAVGADDQLLVAALYDDTGATDTGAVYLFSSSYSPASVSTWPASPASGNSVTLNGTANPNGRTTLGWFEWGLTTQYGNTTAITNVGSGSSAVLVGLPVTNLLANATYHYRIVASNILGVVTGSDRSFQFPFPMVMTEMPSEIAAASATLRGTVNPGGWDLTAWFKWRDADGDGTDETNSIPLHISPRTNSVPLRQPITGLVAGHTYVFELWVTAGSFTAHQAQTFTTPLPPIVVTLSGSSITPSNATLGGSVNPSLLPSRTWFEWGTTASYGNTTSPLDVAAGGASVPVNMAIMQLSGLSDYHFRLVVSNAAGVYYGADNVLSTPPGTEIADGIYVDPTLIPPNSRTPITATATGGKRFYYTPKPPECRVILTRNGLPTADRLQIVSVTPSKLSLNFPAVEVGFYGFLIQNSNDLTHVWEDIYESGPRFFQVGEDAMAHTYHPFPRGNWTVPTKPKNFIGTTSGIITGLISSSITVTQQVLPHRPPWPPMAHLSEFENCGFLYLGWTKDFRLDGEGLAGVELDFSFPMSGVVTFHYEIPFQMILDIPTNVYAGQTIQLKARDFRFHGGVLTAQHNLSFSTEHGLWLNAPYDLGFPPLDNEHSFRPDRLVVWGELPVAPGHTISYGPIDSTDPDYSWMPYAYLFNDGKVDFAEIAAGIDLPDLPDYLQDRISYANVILGGQASYSNTGASTAWSYGPHDVWTTGPHEGWQDTPQLWYANADMVGLAYVSAIPYYSQAAAPLFYLGVELGLNCGVRVRSRDQLNLKPPFTHDLTVRIPATALGSYTIATNFSLPIDATLVSYYLYKLWGGLYFDMPIVDRKDLGWADDDFWRPVVSNNISLAATITLNQPVWVNHKAAWFDDFLLPGTIPADADSDLTSYPPAQADEERRCIANLSFTSLAPPPMVPQVILGTFQFKPESEMVLMLATNAGGGSVAGSPPPVDGGYSNGTLVTVTARAANGYQFAGWAGDATGSNRVVTLTMDDIKTLTPNFTGVTMTGAGYSADGAFHFDVAGEAGQTCIVERATNLSAAVWLPVMTNTLPFTFTGANADNDQHYYRLLFLP